MTEEKAVMIVTAMAVVTAVMVVTAIRVESLLVSVHRVPKLERLQNRSETLDGSIINPAAHAEEPHVSGVDLIDRPTGQ